MATKNFEFRRCDKNEIDRILAIQEEAFATLDNPELLRRNTPEMLLSCLSDPHYTIGAYCEGVLAGFAMLYDAGDSDENLGRDIGCPAEELDKVINLKLVIVSPAYRGNGLQRRMTEKLEEIAVQKNKRYICATVSPDNKFSRANIEGMGYEFHSQKTKYGGVVRNLYCKKI